MDKFISTFFIFSTASVFISYTTENIF